MPYEKQISRNEKGYLIFLVDQSESMNDPIAMENVTGSAVSAKKNYLADVINRALLNLTQRAVLGEEIRDWLDISIIGYGGTTPRVISAFGGQLAGVELASLPDVSNNPVEVVERRVPDGAGGMVDFKLPIWLKPVAQGYTPMCAALRKAAELAAKWIPDHPNSFPPFVLNITDGEATDTENDNPEEAATALRTLTTSDGNVLLYNCHVSSQRAKSVEWPSQESDLPPGNNFAKQLFRMSSVLPQSTIDGAVARGVTIQAGARGFVFNADAALLFNFIDIGTRGGAKGEMR